MSERKAIPVASSVLCRYVGAYRTADGSNRVVIPQGDQIAIQEWRIRLMADGSLGTAGVQRLP
jgi:hypothetical protein